MYLYKWAREPWRTTARMDLIHYAYLMNYRITYYDNAVQEIILAMPNTLKVRYIALTTRMMEYGANLGEPHSKSLGEGLFELRLKGAEGIARVFYCTLIGREIRILHSFVKKTDKIPNKELQIARKRLKECKK